MVVELESDMQAHVYMEETEEHQLEPAGGRLDGLTELFSSFGCRHAPRTLRQDVYPCLTGSSPLSGFRDGRTGRDVTSWLPSCSLSSRVFPIPGTAAWMHQAQIGKGGHSAGNEINDMLRVLSKRYLSLLLADQ